MKPFKITRINYVIQAVTGWAWKGTKKGTVSGYPVFTQLDHPQIPTLKIARAIRRDNLKRWPTARIVKITRTEHHRIVR